MSKLIYHWGIKGMKWGVRRYQNSDGSLTPAGKKRYSDSSSSSSSSDSKKDTPTVKKKSISEMTDSELNEAINRLNLEKRYAELLSKNEPPAKTVSKGKKFVDDLIEKSLIPGVQEGLKTSVSSTISSFVKNQVAQALKEQNAKVNK